MSATQTKGAGALACHRRWLRERIYIKVTLKSISPSVFWCVCIHIKIHLPRQREARVCIFKVRDKSKFESGRPMAAPTEWVRARGGKLGFIGELVWNKTSKTSLFVCRARFFTTLTLRSRMTRGIYALLRTHASSSREWNDRRILRGAQTNIPINQNLKKFEQNGLIFVNFWFTFECEKSFLSIFCLYYRRKIKKRLDKFAFLCL